MSDIGKAIGGAGRPSPQLRFNWLMVAALLGGGAVLYVGFYANYLANLDGIFDISHHPIGRDFLVFWSAAMLAQAGEVATVFDIHAYHAAQQQMLEGTFPLHPWPYPPHLLLLIRPLAWLSYIPAYLAWVITGFAAYLFAVLYGGTVPRRLAPLIGAALFLAPSTFVNIVAGQNGFWTGALFIGGLVLVRRHPILAGILFGLLTVKPQLGVLIPIALIALRQWRPVFAAAATTILLVLLSIAVDGLEVWRLFFTQTIPFQAEVTRTGEGLFTWMMPTVSMAGRLLGFDPTVYGVLQAVSSMGAIVATYWAFRTTRDVPSQLAVISVATFLTVPYAFNYDMTIVAIAAACYDANQPERSFRPIERVPLALLWALPFIVMPLGAFGWPIGPLILWLALGVVLRRVYLAASR